MSQINLPFWEIIRRSFLYTFVNLEIFFKITRIWFLALLYELAFGFPSLCSMDGSICRHESYQNISVLLISLASIAISVSYCRNVILKSQYKIGALPFGARELRYLGYSLLLILIIAIPSVVIIFLLTMLLSIIGVSEYFLRFISLIPLAIAIISARFFIILPAIAVDNKELDLRKAFSLTKGNANKIFWGQILMMIPIILGFTLLSTIYAYVSPVSVFYKLIFVYILLSLTYFDACIKASYYSHIYQYFMYFYHHSKDEVKA